MPQRREIPCPNCGHKLGLNVREERLGKEIQLTCLSCGHTFQTVLSPLAEEQDSTKDPEILQIRAFAQEFNEALYHAVTNDPAILKVVEKIRKAGYDILLRLEADLGFGRSSDAPVEMHEPTPLVQQNGEVVPGVFSEADHHLMGELRIKF